MFQLTERQNGMIYVSTTASLVPSCVNEILLCFICCLQSPTSNQEGKRTKKILSCWLTVLFILKVPHISFKMSRCPLRKVSLMKKHIRGLNRNAQE